MDINNYIKDNPTVTYLVGANNCSISKDAYEKRYHRIHGKGITSMLEINHEERETKFLKECKEAGIRPEQVSMYWYKSQIFSINVKQGLKNYEDIINGMETRLLKYSPKFQPIVRKKLNDPHLMVLDIADLHVGKLAIFNETNDEYNLDIAEQRAIEGVEQLMQKVEHFNLDKIVFIIGNDILHTDSKNRTSTAGTPQDTDGQWHEAVVIAERLYVSIIEKLLTVADIHIIFNRSNHDEHLGYMLAKIIKAYFRNSKNITFDIDMTDRKYYQYGQHMIGTTHGDGVKRHNLPLIMAQEQPDMWSKTKKRFFYIHHIHHYSKAFTEHGKDYVGVTVESLRSPSGTDAWHSKMGYLGNQAIECFLHSKNNLSTGKFTHYF